MSQNSYSPGFDNVIERSSDSGVKLEEVVTTVVRVRRQMMDHIVKDIVFCAVGCQFGTTDGRFPSSNGRLISD